MNASRRKTRLSAGRWAVLPALAAVMSACGPSLPAPPQQIPETAILLKRGDGFYFNSRFEEAAREYGRAVELDPRSGAALRHRGRAFLAMGRFDEARRDFDGALALDGGDGEAYLARGALSFRQGKYAEAIDDFDRAVEVDPWNAAARYYKAVACEKVGRLREAVEAYKAYIHCTIPRDEGAVEHALERIRELESGPLR